ncbi:MAG: hypothetical protein ACM31O_06115 [Bacteroidota bacterium]
MLAVLVGADGNNDQDRCRDDVRPIPRPHLRKLLAPDIFLNFAKKTVCLIGHVSYIRSGRPALAQAEVPHPSHIPTRSATESGYRLAEHGFSPF